MAKKIKIKTHSGAKKRFNISKNGKVKYQKTNRRHRLTQKATKLDGLGSAVQHHAVGCFCFSDGILAEIQCLAFRRAVFVCGQRINDRTFGIAQSSVRRDDILGGSDFIGCPCEVFIRKHKAVYAVRFHGGEENLTAFGNVNVAFLRHIELLEQWFSRRSP